jgi:hypothetical protein
VVIVLFRVAHLLASSFNFQGKVKKTFFVLTDDKVGSGPRLRPGALAQGHTDEPTEEVQPMETDNPVQSTSSTPTVAAPQPTLSAKLAAQAVKRKATEQLSPATAKQKPK